MAAARPDRPSSLPAPLTPFIGHERLVAEVCERLLRPDVRLLTLTGPGGVGKTRLALAVAAEAAPHVADVFFVALAPVSDPELVIPTIAQAVGLRDPGGASVVDPLISFLRGRELLLILDNFEHVVAAAPFVVRLVAACPRVKVIVTSRSVLRVSGERDIPVIDAGSRFTAVTLRGGELFVVDSTDTPMAIVAEYDAATVSQNGCGGVETADGTLYLNAGGGTPTHPFGSSLCALNVSDFTSAPRPRTPRRRRSSSASKRGSAPTPTARR